MSAASVGPAPRPAPPALSLGALGPRYGGLGFPLAFVALPLYVLLPQHYASTYGLPLAWLGALLLAARLGDAAADPWIGRWADRLLGHSTAQRHAVLAASACGLALGFVALFFPPPGLTPALLMAWAGAALMLTYLCYSVLSVLHQAWGARLGGDDVRRAGIVAWREGLALAGVLVASALPSLAGLVTTTLVLVASLAIALALLQRAPAPEPTAPSVTGPLRMREPLTQPAFRRLLLVYLVNGIASAIPATLVLFYIRDRLQAPQYEALFLVSYFAAAALSMPLWVRAVARWGLVRSWLAGMVLAMAVFVWASGLGTGDVAGFLAVCALSGLALGADLTVPGALLAGLIHTQGHGQHGEGTYFGWWNFATKLNLALAAGLALPLLQWGGYAPGERTPAALHTLTLAYCLLPCALKLAAALLLARSAWHSPHPTRTCP